MGIFSSISLFFIERGEEKQTLIWRNMHAFSSSFLHSLLWLLIFFEARKGIKLKISLGNIQDLWNQTEECFWLGGNKPSQTHMLLILCLKEANIICCKICFSKNMISFHQLKVGYKSFDCQTLILIIFSLIRSLK